jgi:hypothetical protein
MEESYCLTHPVAFSISATLHNSRGTSTTAREEVLQYRGTGIANET